MPIKTSSIRFTDGEKAALRELAAKHDGDMKARGIVGRCTATGLLRTFLRKACSEAGIPIAGSPGPVSVPSAAPKAKPSAKAAQAPKAKPSAGKAPLAKPAQTSKAKPVKPATVAKPSAKAGSAKPAKPVKGQ